MSVARAIRTVKTPVIPREDEESRRRRCELALRQFREDLESLEKETDPDLLELCEGAVSDILWEARHLRANTRPGWTPVPDLIPGELARRLAAENWRKV